MFGQVNSMQQFAIGKGLMLPILQDTIGWNVFNTGASYFLMMEQFVERAALKRRTTRKKGFLP
jgi:hypothetical protein